MREKLKQIKRITEETALSLGVVFVIAAIVFSLSRALFQIEAVAGDTTKLDIRVSRNENRFIKLERRLYRIEGALKIKEREPLDGEDQ